MRAAIALVLAGAAAACGQVLVVPAPLTVNTGNSCTNVALNSGQTRTGMTFVTTDTAITGVIFRAGAVTAGGDVAVRLYEVDSNGLPTGSPIDLATVSVSAANTFYTATWSPQAVTPGTMYALMLEFASYSGQDFQAQNCSGSAIQRPFSSLYFNGSTWSTSSGVMLWILGSNGFVLPETQYLPVFRSVTSFSTNSSPNERGIACTFPYSMRVFAVRYYGGTIATGPAVVNVYRDGELVASANAIPASSTYAYVAAPVDIAIEAGVEYIASVRPTTTAATGFLAWNLNAWAGFPTDHADSRRLMGQAHCQAVYRTGAGAWTYDPATVHQIQFLAVPGGM